MEKQIETPEQELVRLRVLEDNLNLSQLVNSQQQFNLWLVSEVNKIKSGINSIIDTINETEEEPVQPQPVQPAPATSSVRRI